MKIAMLLEEELQRDLFSPVAMEELNTSAENTGTGNHPYPSVIEFIRYNAFHASRRMCHQFQIWRVLQHFLHPCGELACG